MSAGGISDFSAAPFPVEANHRASPRTATQKSPDAAIPRLVVFMLYFQMAIVLRVASQLARRSTTLFVLKFTRFQPVVKRTVPMPGLATRTLPRFRAFLRRPSHPSKPFRVFRLTIIATVLAPVLVHVDYQLCLNRRRRPCVLRDSGGLGFHTHEWRPIWLDSRDLDVPQALAGHRGTGKQLLPSTMNS